MPIHHQVRSLAKHPLISGGMIIYFGTFLANILNFLYNIFMIHILPVSDYGILGNLSQLMTLPSIAGIAVTPTIVRYAGVYFANNELNMLHGFYKKITTVFFILGIITFVLLLVFTQQISNFFHISDNSLLFFTDLAIFLSFVTFINQGFLQAKLAFRFQAFLNFLTALIKLVFGILLVYLGFKVLGAIFALLLSGLIPFLVSFTSLKFVFNKGIKEIALDTKEIFTYGIPSAVAVLSLTSLITTDMLLVKHFDDPVTAGMYTGLSLIGRVIFFLSAPMAGVMFPLVVQKHSRGENYTNTFKLAVLIVLLPSLMITLLYYLFPNFFIWLFSKSAYLSVAQYLWLFGAFTTTYSVVALIVNFYLSIKKTIVWLPVLITAILQGVLIWFYHSSFITIIEISLTVTFVLLIVLLLYYPYATKKS